ncbi:MAG: MmgE/PrpD family protein, partial [Chloroflexota bacterium]|nr:MmgE/PrpD family protein [Chloroflexota bacterium]
LGRERRASGPETLAAVVAGYEAAGRLGRALRSADLLRRGWWPSAVCGAFGAAATAARLLALDAGGTREALALALQHTGGLGGRERGAHGRLLLYAAAARAGITAARVAGAGMRGPSAILGGPRGIAAAYAIEVDPSPLDTPAVPDVISGVTIKPWACARQLHAAVEAALELRESRTGPIDEVVVSVPPASAFVDRPSRDQGAAGSAQWVIATALVRGSVGLGDLAEDVPDADEVARLARRVRVEAVDAMPALAGAVAVRARGSTARHEVLVPRGGRQRPLDAGDVRAKASTIVQRALCDRAPAFVDAASTMDDRSTLDALSAWWESIAAR